MCYFVYRIFEIGAELENKSPCEATGKLFSDAVERGLWKNFLHPSRERFGGKAPLQTRSNAAQKSPVKQKVSLARGYIGDVFGLGVFGEQVIKRLVLRGSHLRRNRQPPFLGVAESGVDVEDDASERIEPVPNHLADLEFGGMT